MIEHHAKDCLDMLQKYFKFELSDEDNSLTITEKIFENIKELEQQKRLWHYAETEWMAYQNMYSIVAKIKLKKRGI